MSGANGGFTQGKTKFMLSSTKISEWDEFVREKERGRGRQIGNEGDRGRRERERERERERGGEGRATT